MIFFSCKVREKERERKVFLCCQFYPPPSLVLLFRNHAVRMGCVPRRIGMTLGLPFCSSTELSPMSFHIRIPRVPGEMKSESGVGNWLLNTSELAAVQSPRARKLPRRTQWVQPSLHWYLSICMAWIGVIGSRNGSTVVEHMDYGSLKRDTREGVQI